MVHLAHVCETCQRLMAEPEALEHRDRGHRVKGIEEEHGEDSIVDVGVTDHHVVCDPNQIDRGKT